MNQKKILITVLVVILIVIIWGVFGRGSIGTKPPTTGPEVTEEPKAEEPVAEEKSPVEIAFDKTEDVEIIGEKANVVDAILRPALKSVFDTVVDDQIVSGVKMKEEFGPMLTYVFNRVVTEADMTAVKTGLEAQGFETAEMSGRGMTMMKVGQTWVLTFWLNNQQKAGLEITF